MTATNNHQSRNTIRFDPAIVTTSLTIHLKRVNGNGETKTVPAALMEVRCY
ncbi:hypothetical protein [Spirosoma panaciterrae]|uniref:hypothetical protein n=1 Tax=Spirosoma panaciterrae TaxID=496058 RepID=UPI00037582BD|nr:hypothetical protein [Spirosoma panaciterrae]